jgi:hypothetical protein
MRIDRLERMVREAVYWAPIWGEEWAMGYIRAAILAEDRDRAVAREKYRYGFRAAGEDGPIATTDNPVSRNSRFACL